MKYSLAFLFFITNISFAFDNNVIYEYNPKYEQGQSRANKNHISTPVSSNELESTEVSADGKCHRYDAEFLELNKKLHEQNNISNIIPLQK